MKRVDNGKSSIRALLENYEKKKKQIKNRKEKEEEKK